jgi:hypothetical protein
MIHDDVTITSIANLPSSEEKKMENYKIDIDLKTSVLIVSATTATAETVVDNTTMIVEEKELFIEEEKERKAFIATHTTILGKKKIFFHQQPTAFAVIEGSGGLGKSALLESMYRNVLKHAKEEKINIFPIQSICGSLDGHQPYKGWKSILRHLLVQFSRLAHFQHAPGSEKKEHEKLKELWVRGALYIKEYLSVGIQPYLSLLSTARMIPGLEEESIVTALSGNDRLKYLGALIREIVLLFPFISVRMSLYIFFDSVILLTFLKSLIIFILSCCVNASSSVTNKLLT